MSFVRKNITLGPEHVKFIDERSINLSRFIQKQIQKEIVEEIEEMEVIELNKILVSFIKESKQ